jgi:hypothetical protein
MSPETRSGAENGPRTRSQENRTSENAFVNMFPFSNPTLPAGGAKRTNKNQHGGQEETFSARNAEEQVLEYDDVAMFPMIPFPSIRNHGTCSRILGPFRNAEVHSLEYAPGYRR